MRKSIESSAGKAFELTLLCRYFSERSPLPQAALEGMNHIVRYVNEAFCRLVGKRWEDLIDRPFAQAVPEGKENGCLSLLDRVFLTGTAEPLPEQQHCQETTCYWSYVVWPILGEEEHPAGVMVQVTDATEIAVFRKQAVAMNAALMISSTQQHQLTQTAGELNMLLQAALSEKDYFVSVLSHELRTPLAPVLLAIPMLQQDKRLDEATRQTLEMVHRNVKLEARLIDDLLDLTRLERGKMDLDRRPVDLCRVIERAIEVCRGDLEAARLTLEVATGAGPHVVNADADRMQQVFWNLLRNAIKFTPAGGHIRVHCRREGDSSVIAEITDTGSGIEAELLPRMFDAFEQGEKGRARKGGLGLGLAISRTIVQMHEGTISAQSEGKDMGALFSIRLPIMVDQHPVQVGALWAETKRPTQASRILLVEDHVDTARIMCQLLGMEGHAVELASDVAQALQLAETGEFDLLLCDLGLPDGTGLDLMRALRERGYMLPGIVISGYGKAEDVARSVEAGFVAHLIKPVSPEKLCDAITASAGNRNHPR